MRREQDSACGSEGQSEYVGRFRTGRLAGNRPEALDTWRVTTATLDVATGVASLLGGEPAEWETTAEDSLEVLTDYDMVRIIVEGPSAIRARMLLFGYQGKVLHDCDGTRLLAPEANAGKPCGCPETFEERKLAAKSGRGPAPSICINFKLADEPALGRFRFVSSSWELAKTVADLQRALTEADGPTTCDLALELVELTTASGVAVCYRKPVVRVLDDPALPAPYPAVRRPSRMLPPSHASSDVPARSSKSPVLPGRQPAAPHRSLNSVVSGLASVSGTERTSGPDAPEAVAQPRTAAGVLFFDEADRVLLVKPTYKPGWEIPGGYLHPGETPSDGAAREVKEELGITPPVGRLLVADWAPHPTEGDKLLFVFDGGILPAEERAQINLDGVEIGEYAFHTADQIDMLLIPRLARRVQAALDARSRAATSYLEHGTARL
ncbi:NUDIX domain-containing protein [Kitasatospora sp. MAA19]|uniref:NUDIX domain-containing protein n=1 Tax=Kitasatospora sp. MAA19 TaxID=3035090 RepID=UPI0032AEE184